MVVWKQTGRRPPGLHTLKIPPSLEYLWAWWNELRGYERLTFTEIQAWVTLTGVYIDREEVLALKTLDALYWRLTTSE